MKKLMIIVLAVLLSTGIAFAENQNGKGTSGPQGVGHSTGNQGNGKNVGNAGGGSDVGCGSCGNGPDYSGPAPGSYGVASVGGGTGLSGFNSNKSYDGDPQFGYRNFKEPGCSLVEWFKNDFTCP